MFPTPQAAITKYVKGSRIDISPVTHTGESFAFDIAIRLFKNHVYSIKLCQYWLRFALEKNNSMIGFIFKFCRFVHHEPIELSISDKTFSIFKSLKYAASFDSIDPFDRSIMDVVLAKDNNILFKCIIASGNSVRAERFKYNDYIERYFDRWAILEWLFYYILLSDTARVFTIKGVLSSVSLQLGEFSSIKRIKTMKSPCACSSDHPIKRLTEIIDGFRCW